jgi:hypothetical protein
MWVVTTCLRKAGGKISGFFVLTAGKFFYKKFLYRYAIYMLTDRPTSHVVINPRKSQNDGVPLSIQSARRFQNFSAIPIDKHCKVCYVYSVSFVYLVYSATWYTRYTVLLGIRCYLVYSVYGATWYTRYTALYISSYVYSALLYFTLTIDKHCQCAYYMNLG